MNEYHEKFEELQDRDTFKGQQWFGERKELVEKYSWAVPNEDVLLYLAEFEEIIEVGAGNGYWTKCINDAGGNVEATDIDPPDKRWADVEEVGVSAVAIDDRPVLLVWPALNEGVATAVAEKEPPHILYVGEPRGGCTGEEEFFDSMKNTYGLVAKVEIPSYAGVHDDLYHYVKKR